MNKEWQEASNELLIVSIPDTSETRRETILTINPLTATTGRPSYRYLFRELQGPWYGPVAPQELLNILRRAWEMKAPKYYMITSLSLFPLF